MAAEIDQLRRERDSLARRCAVRFEETEAALAVIRRYIARWHPEIETGLWWRNDLRASQPITSAEMAALRRALDEDAGAAGPQATPDQENNCRHVCCDEPHNPHHDHFLSADQCPSCERVRAMRRQNGPGMEGR